MSDSIDLARAEAFGGRIVQILNDGALCLMISIGHRTGLFDVMAGLPAATSEEIAVAAGLDERYVREWLGATATGGLVEYEADSDRYVLPPEHAASLTRKARPANMAATAQWVPLLATVEDEIVDCFEHGGGVPYSAYPRFHAVMAEESDQSVVAVLEEAILPSVPGLVSALESGIDVLDVGCGSGRALARMARSFPKSRFTGYDVSQEAVSRGRAAAEDEGLKNLRFEVRDVAGLEVGDAYDLVTAFDAIHDQADPARVLAGIHHALRDDGTFLMQEIGGSSHVHEDVNHPLAPFLYTVSCMHCMTVSLSDDGAGLGAMWGEQVARKMLGEAGFARVEVRDLPHDPINKYYTARP